jgi:hypothetical protein
VFLSKGRPGQEVPELVSVQCAGSLGFSPSIIVIRSLPTARRVKCHRWLPVEVTRIVITMDIPMDIP